MDKWLRNKNVIRVFSLLIAILLWAVVQYDMQGSVDLSNASPSKERTLSNVSIRFIGLDENKYVLTSTSNKHVNVKISGKQKIVDQFSLSDGNSLLLADLSNVSVGNRKVFLQASGFPSDLDVVIQPNFITLTIEKKVEQTFPISVNVIGEPAEGFVLGSSNMNPLNAVISGLKSNIDRVSQIIAKVDVNDANQTISNEYILEAIDSNGNIVDVSIKPTNVKIETEITTNKSDTSNNQ